MKKEKKLKLKISCTKWKGGLYTKILPVGDPYQPPLHGRWHKDIDKSEAKRLTILDAIADRQVEINALNELLQEKRSPRPLSVCSTFHQSVPWGLR